MIFYLFGMNIDNVDMSSLIGVLIIDRQDVQYLGNIYSQASGPISLKLQSQILYIDINLGLRQELLGSNG